MPIQGPVHEDRQRAESFGSVARRYDQYRPSYPPALIDDLEVLRPGPVLDVGCGTGKAAVLLAARGLDVLGLEPDRRMAEVARGHGLDVEVAAFETWCDAGRVFDLITCAQAWHWIEPATGAGRAADLLRPGGVLALFWNHSVDWEEPIRAAFDEVYRVHAPELLDAAVRDRRPAADTPYVADLEASGRFASIEVRDYESHRAYASDEWVGMVQTHSDHLALAPERCAALAGGLHELIDRLGGAITVRVGTYLILART